MHKSGINHAYNKNCIAALIFPGFLPSTFICLFSFASPLSFTHLTNSSCGFQMATRGTRLCTSGGETQWKLQIRNTGGFTSLISWGSGTPQMCSQRQQVGKVALEGPEKAKTTGT